MKIFGLILMVGILSGCGQVQRGVAVATGYSNVCVNGVNYLQFPSGATVQLDQNGRPVSCQKQKSVIFQGFTVVDFWDIGV